MLNTSTNYSKNNCSTKYKTSALYAFAKAKNSNGLGNNINANFYTTYSSNSASGGSDPGYDPIGNYTDLLDFGIKANSYKELTKNTSAKPEVKDDSTNSNYVIMGPFKANFGVKKINNAKIWVGTNSTTWNSNFKVAKCGTTSWSSDLGTIKSGESFKIKMKKSAIGLGNVNTKITVRFYQESMDYYKARLVLAYKPVATAQQLGIFAARKYTNTGYETWEAVYKYQEPPPEYSDYKLQITKTDDSGNKIKDAEFVIMAYEYNNNNNSWNNPVGWLKHVDYYDNTYTGIDSKDDPIQNRNKWKTNINGKIQINNLTTRYRYKVYEYKIPSTDFVDLKNQVKNGMTVKINKEEVDNVGYNDNINSARVKGIYCGSIKNDTSLSVSMDVMNVKKKFTLNIKKLDSDGNKLKNVKFKIKTRIGSTDKGWLQKNGSSYTYTSGYTAGTTFNTTYDANSDGEISISGLSATYNYVIYEIDNDSGNNKLFELSKQIDNGMTVNFNGEEYTDTDSYNKIQYIRTDSGGINVESIRCGTVKTQDYMSNNVNKCTVEIINVKPINIKITKKDNETGNNLPGAKFKIRVDEFITGENDNYGGTKTVGWLSVDPSTGNYKYDSSFNDAKEYTTNGSGIITINNLSPNYIYRINEVAVPSGYMDIEKQFDNGMTVLLNGEVYKDAKKKTVNSSIDVNYCCPVYSGSKANANNVNEVEVTNVKSSANISIEKLNDAGTLLDGAGFKIEVYQGSSSIGWLYQSGGKYTYNKSFNQATEFNTIDGVIDLKGLSTSYKYRIYETKVADNCMNIDEQKDGGMTVYKNGVLSNVSNEIRSGNKVIYCGEADGTSTTTEFKFKITNMRSKTNITISKENDYGENAIGAGFKIRVYNGNTPIGWLSESGTNYNYTNSFSNATQYETNSGGKIYLTGLDRDYKYVVYETKVANKCVGIDKQVSKGMTVKRNNVSVTPIYDSSLQAINCGEAISTNSVSKFTFNIENIRTEVDITINKKNELGNKLKGAKFKIRVDQGDNKTYWLKIYNNTYYYNNQSFLPEQTTWTTDSNGTVSIKGLNPNYTYYVYEWEQPANCMSLAEYSNGGMKVWKNGTLVSSEVKKEHIDGKDRINCGSVQSNTSNDTTFTLDIENKREKTSITINKKNDAGQIVKGAGFKIRVYSGSTEIGWLSGNESNYSYTNNFNNATQYETNSSGKIELKGLSLDYTYKIYETKLANQCVSFNEQISGGMKVNGSRLTSSNLQTIDGQQVIYCGETNKSQENQKFVYDITNIKTKLKMSITKKNDEGDLLSGVGFKIQVFEGNTSKGWLDEVSGEYYFEGVTFNGAKTYTTSNGYLEIKKLPSDYKYKLYEVSVSGDAIPLEKQVDGGMKVYKNGTLVSGVQKQTISGKTVIYCGDISSITTDTDFALEITNVKPKVNIKINKNDENSTGLKGAEFKIKIKETGKWLGYNETNRQYDYTRDYNSAKTWKMTSTSIEINGLTKNYTYEIYETKSADNCLSIDKQYDAGMTVKIGRTEQAIREVDVNGNKTIKCGEVKYTNTNNDSQTVTLNIVNIEDYLDISGRIWEDFLATKADTYNSRYGSEDKLSEKEVTISLYDESNQEIRRVTTNNGTYHMETPITVATSMSESQISDKLQGYYLVFKYNSEYKEENSMISYYSTVSPSTDTNGSKALPEKDKDTAGIAYIYKLSEYVKDNYKNEPQNHVLENMNMGLVKIESSYDYTIDQVIDYVKVVINKHTYTYKYGENGKIKAETVPSMSWNNGWAYTRPIYPSDIHYTNKIGWDDDDSLKVYVVYKITIKNTGSSGTRDSTGNQNSYIEKSLQVESLINNYDTQRYELETDYEKSTNSDFEKWSANNGVAKYTGNKFNNNGLLTGEERTVSIQFKVKKEALQKLIEGDTFEKNQKPTKAIANAYHKYNKKYYIWDGSKKQENYTQEDNNTLSVEKSAASIYLKLTLGKNRVLTGKVFEDNKVSTNGEGKGNGKYDSGENNIENVTVKLIDESGHIAETYPYDSTKPEGYTRGNATTTSGNDGTYSIDGIVPGNYSVRFTYGDGTSYDVKDYKSTIITEDNVKTALIEQKTDIKKKVDWYQDVTGTDYSTAVDDLEQRAEINTGKDKNGNAITRTEISANTAIMDIGIENTKENSVTIETSDAFDINNPTPYGTVINIEGINFGIIENPKVEIETEKVVDYIKITNTQGNIIAEGNPANQDIPYVSNLDGGTHDPEGSTYVKAEINEQELYGSTLEIHYSITVKNKSELNYYEINKDAHYGYYYMFGDKNYATEVYHKVNTVYDYIDSSVKSENVSIDSPYNSDIKETSTATALVENVHNITDCDYNYIIEITGWGKELYSGIVSRSDGKLTQETANLKVSRLLSADNDDLVVSNVAQVINFEKPSSELLPPLKTQEPSNEAIVTVLPPTGADMLTTAIYIIVTAIAGITIVGGIIIIKKKVLNK